MTYVLIWATYPDVTLGMAHHNYVSEISNDMPFHYQPELWPPIIIIIEYLISDQDFDWFNT